jgi:tRNA modification GTPase
MTDGAYAEDTIAAIATAPGEGGVAIVRVSGARAQEIARAIFQPKRAGGIKAGRFRYGHVLSEDGEVIDEALCVFFRAPNSYTAEDVAEIQCHGGRAQARRVLSRALSAGARMAQPGEFTRRAYENGRLSLPEAEAVLALVRADGEYAARAAVRQLSGSAARFLSEVRAHLTGALSRIEATIDFPDEVKEDEISADVYRALNAAQTALDGAIDERGAKAVREGAFVVLAGRENVGKSSLLNAMLRRERAIVSEMPGTTRDVLIERITLDGLPVEIADTAGQRASDDPIEALGVQKARAAQAEADVVFLVFDAQTGLTAAEDALLLGADERTTFVVNKCDAQDPAPVAKAMRERTGKTPLCVSAKTGEGIDALFDALRARLKPVLDAEITLLTVRQIACAKAARAAIERALDAAKKYPLDIVAADIWAALGALRELSGEDAREDVIDGIFKNFCVGK